MKLPFFGKKKPEAIKGKGFVPVDRARQLMSKGFSETEVIDVLRREGYSAEEIDKALTETLKAGVAGASVPSPAVPAQPTFPSAPATATPQPAVAAQAPAAAPSPSAAATATAPAAEAQPTFPPRHETKIVEAPKPKAPSIEDLKAKPQMPVVPETSLPEQYAEEYPTEEYIDYVVQEHMSEVLQALDDFAKRHEKLEKKINQISAQISKLSESAGKPQTGRMEEFSESLEDVNARLASLEKAFKETLPALIESVRALSDLVQRLKREG